MKYILWLLFLLTTAVYGQQNIKDLTVQDLKVVSTVKGSKPCPLMTQAQRDAIASPLNGQCLYNTTTSKLNIYNGSVWKAAGGGVDAWATATVYAVGDLVIQSSKIYQCLIAHTSGVFATDLAALNWQEISVGITDHTLLSNIGTNSHADIDSHISSTSNPHSVTKTQVGLGNVVDADTTTTANITDSSNKRFMTDAQETNLDNQSGTNTGDNSVNSLYSGLAASKQDTLVSATNIKTVNGSSILGAGDLTVLGADLTGPITSASGTTAIASQTGTGTKFVVDNSPTLITPNIGAALGDSLSLGGSLTAGTIISASSTTQAVIFPRMTTAQKNAITPVAGMELYDTDLNVKQYYNGTQWVANTSIQLDNNYSARAITTSGTVSQENKDFISGNCSAANPTVCTFVTGRFTVAPNCVATVDNNTGVTVEPLSVSATSASFRSYATSSGSPIANVTFTIACQKQGADYQSADAYIASNGNYSRRAYTPTFTGFGTVSNVECYESRDGEFLEVDCRFTAGTPTATEARISLPTGLTSSSLGVVRVAGKGNNTLVSVTRFSGITPLIEPSVTYFTLAAETSSTNGLTKNNGNSLIDVGGNISFTARVPIQGWTNSNLIVASLAGTPNVPGLTTAIDTFSVSYGTTNSSTNCSASPCSFLDQIGTAVVSITRSGTGTYTLNTSRTYSKLKCLGGFSNTAQAGLTMSQTSPMSCANCNSLTFATGNTVALFDSFGILDCKGSY
jgi:hypothetical protein